MNFTDFNCGIIAFSLHARVCALRTTRTHSLRVVIRLVLIFKLLKFLWLHGCKERHSVALMIFRKNN